MAINKAVSIAEPYFNWRAERAVSTSEVNVINASSSLFDRYVFFRDKFRALSAEADRLRGNWSVVKSRLADGSEVTSYSNSAYLVSREATWNAQAAIEAFYSWTEHVFIHLVILQCKLQTGDKVAALAASNWKAKFQAALDINEKSTKQHYDKLLKIRAQIRNLLAHGAFGKSGEAFRFHSGAGAVPVLLIQGRHRRYTLTGKAEFDEGAAIDELESFVIHLWSASRAPAKIYAFSELPSILTYASDGTYRRAMESEQNMTEFIKLLMRKFADAANMDW